MERRLRHVISVFAAGIITAVGVAVLRGSGYPEPPLRFWCVAEGNFWRCRPGLYESPGGNRVAGFENIEVLEGCGDGSPHYFGDRPSALQRAIFRFDEGLAQDLGCGERVVFEADVIEVRPASTTNESDSLWVRFLRRGADLPSEARVDPRIVGAWQEDVPYWACQSGWSIYSDGRYRRDLSGLPRPRVENGTWAVLDDVLVTLDDAERGTRALVLSADRRSWRGAEGESAERR